MTAKRQPVTYPPPRKPLTMEDSAPAGPPAVAPTAASEEAKAAPAEALGVAPSRAGKKAVTFYLPREKWLALRTTSLRTGRPTHELMAEATDWLLGKYQDRAGEGT